MTENETEQAGTLLGLFEAHLTSHDRRRSYEWKLSLAIWASLAAFIALAMRGEIRMQGCSWVPIIIALGVVLFLQGLFQWRVTLANKCDQEKSLVYWRKLNEAVSLVGEFEGETEAAKAIEKVKKGRWRGWWGTVVHLGITAVLMICAVFVLFQNRT